MIFRGKQIRVKCGVPGPAAIFWQEGSFLSRVSAKKQKKTGYFFLAFWFFFKTPFWVVFVVLGGVFVLFWGFVFRFSRVSTKVYWGVNFKGLPHQNEEFPLSPRHDNKAAGHHADHHYFFFTGKAPTSAERRSIFVTPELTRGLRKTTQNPPHARWRKKYPVRLLPYPLALAMYSNTRARDTAVPRPWRRRAHV